MTPALLAVVPVRDGALPLGGDEAVSEAEGRAVLVGSGAEAAAASVTAPAWLGCVEVGDFRAGAWAAALAAVPAVREAAVLVLPGSPDGRDLAPRLAHALGRPLLAGATQVGPERVVVARQGGLVSETHVVRGPSVTTLEPGVRRVAAERAVRPVVETIAVEALLPASAAGGPRDAEVLALLPPDPATVDLGEAKRIVAGGAGLGGPEPFVLLREVALALGASFGATRVASDVGWAPHDRYIGTTGVTVSPELYVALGISGAVQHVSGLGDPVHVIAVNTDASAPMMALADLAIVTDARALLVELARRLGVESEGAALEGSGHG